MEKIFNSGEMNVIINRLSNLRPDAQPKWGKMNVAQMLAHLNIAYETIFEPEKYPRPNGLMKYVMRWFVKPVVTGPENYKRNSKTASFFIVSPQQDFEKQRSNLIANIHKVLDLGEVHFHNKESHSFGKLTAAEWSNMLFKHLDHHLNQFGV